MKKTLLRTLTFLLLALPGMAQAQLSGNGFDYIINPYETNTITITNYIGLSGIVTIPSTINGLTVTTIGNGSNAVFTGIDVTNVTIPDSVITIADYAFYTNYYMTNVTIGANVTSIGEESFYECESLTNVTIPNSVLSIGYDAFYYCYYMTNVTIGNNVFTIDDGAFEYCYDLQQVTIPKSVTSIGEYAFYYCEYMTNLTILGAPDIGYGAFYEDSYLQNATIAGGIIEDEVFYECEDLTNLNLGNVSSIGYYSFYYCYSLTNLTIPASVTRIGEYAFYDCEYMTNLTILGNPSIGEYAFYECYDLNTATINGGSIGYYAFYDCSALTNLVIGNGPASIGYGAFYDDSYLTNVTMGTNVSSIAAYAFYDCEYMKSATISGSLDPYAFDDCDELATLTVNNGIIPDYMFESLYSLTNVTINYSSIGSDAFYNCEGLINLTIGPGVTNIGDEAFYYCEYMTNAVINSGYPGYYCFAYCYYLSNLTIGKGVTGIGEYAFYDCGIPNVTIPNTVTNLGVGAFYYCYNLTNATVNSANIADDAFYDCYYLTNLTFGSSVTQIGSEVLDECTNLAAVYFQGDAPVVSGALFTGTSATGPAVYYYAGTVGWGPFLAGLPTTPLAPNALQITLGPTAARTNGASWQLDNSGVLENAPVTTLVDQSPGSHTVAFTPIAGWMTPSNQTVTITNGKTATVFGLYIQTNIAAPASGLVLQTNGYGTIHHAAWSGALTIGKKYTVTAVPDLKNVFVSWAGGTNQPYAELGTKASYTFTMESNLLLTANFTTNPFIAVSGIFNGIFTGANGVTEETSGMIRNLDILKTGSYSGGILINGRSYGISGSFNYAGMATNHISRAAVEGGRLDVVLTINADFSPPEITGILSGTNGTGTNAVPWTANLAAYLATTNLHPAQYTMLVQPATNTAPTNSPGGDSYMLITNNHAGMARITGALADGTILSATAPVSQGSYVPIYANLYASNGLILGWINLDTSSPAVNNLTWIHPVTTNGLYQGGFTNVLPTGQIMLSQWTNPPGDLDLLTTLSLLGVCNDTNTLTTNITVSTSASGQVSGTSVNGSINRKTGLLRVNIGSGTSRVTGYGAILLDANGNATNSGGYFLTTTNSQGIELTVP